MAALGIRGMTGGEQYGHIITRCIHKPTQGIGTADCDMHHNHGRFARYQVITVGHGHGRIFVGHRDKFRNFPSLFFCRDYGLDYRGEIGTGIGKDIFNTPVCQGVQITGSN